ncbi:NUDIX hydrolase [Mariniluteicoccus flavus]
MEPYAGVHSWEVFEHVPNADLGRMPAAIAGQLSAGAGRTPVEPRPSATVVPLRRGPGGAAEAWLMRRRDTMRFGGLWAFPGGKLEPGDEAHADPLRECAVRELAEETGCVAAPDDLVTWARWITPEPLAYRFDTWFFLWVVPAGVDVVPGAQEAIEGRWVTGLDDLESGRGADPGEAAMMPPTRAALLELGLLGSLDRVLEAARGRVVESVTPRWVSDGQAWRSSYPLRSGEWQ